MDEQTFAAMLRRFTPMGYADVLRSVGSGMAGQAAGGLRGLGTLATGGGLDRAVANIEDTEGRYREAGKPQTPEGQENMSRIAQLMRELPKQELPSGFSIGETFEPSRQAFEERATEHPALAAGGLAAATVLDPSKGRALASGLRSAAEHAALPRAAGALERGAIDFGDPASVAKFEAKVGKLAPSEADAPRTERLQNPADVVAERIAELPNKLPEAEPWKAREYAFPRSDIKQAMGGWPGREQTQFNRYEPRGKSDLSHVDEMMSDPTNRELIKFQIERGLPLGGETFYASLWPLVGEAESRGIPRAQVERWIESGAPGSARNSILNENAVSNMMINMHHRGIELTPENVRREMDAFKERTGSGLPLMDVHRGGVKEVLESGDASPLREKLTRELRLASDRPSYKVGTYGLNKAGDFAKSWTGDVHEAAGLSQGSRYHPYFTDAGGFESRPGEYGLTEKYMQGIADEVGVPLGTAQAGRWFGGGEATGLMSPRGDALDILEKQVAYTLKEQGKEFSPKAVRDYTMQLIQQGGDLMPWFSRKTHMPDVRF